MERGSNGRAAMRLGWIVAAGLLAAVHQAAAEDRPGQRFEVSPDRLPRALRDAELGQFVLAPAPPGRCDAPGAGRLQGQHLCRSSRSRALDDGRVQRRRAARRAARRQGHAAARQRQGRPRRSGDDVRRRLRPAARSRHPRRLSLCRRCARGLSRALQDRRDQGRRQARAGRHRGRARQRRRSLDAQHRLQPGRRAFLRLGRLGQQHR